MERVRSREAPAPSAPSAASWSAASGGAVIWLGQLMSSVLAIVLTSAILVALLAVCRSWGKAQPADPSRHRCGHCAKVFDCRGLPKPAPRIAPGGAIRGISEGGAGAGAAEVDKPASAPAGRARRGINSFVRKTVHVGSLPIEVATAGDSHTCPCGAAEGGATHVFWCSFACYQKLRRRPA
jgi:hypothetical protein